MAWIQRLSFLCFSPSHPPTPEIQGWWWGSEGQAGGKRRRGTDPGPGYLRLGEKRETEKQKPREMTSQKYKGKQRQSK